MRRGNLGRGKTGERGRERKRGPTSGVKAGGREEYPAPARFDTRLWLALAPAPALARISGANDAVSAETPVRALAQP
jgi:hypothetical protein